MKLKRFLPALLVMLLGLFFTSCNDDDDGYSMNKYWISMATVENPDNNRAFIFETDGNKRMWTAATNFYNYHPADGQRIIANYTILGNARDQDDYDYLVKLNDAYNVLTKSIFTITPETQDSIGNDPANITDIWIGSDYLNVEFVYRGYNRSHFINLVSDTLKQYNDGKTHLEFRHNAKGDSQVYVYRGIVSFNLKSLQQEGMESVDLVIHSKRYSSPEEKTYDLTYKFNSRGQERTLSIDEEEGFAEIE